MSKVSVFDHAWIDMVFEGRNQSYGAYQLRRQDPKTTMLALLSGIGLMVSFVGIPTVINYFSPTEIVADTPVPTGGIVIHDIEPPIFVEPEKPKPEEAFKKSAAPAPAAPAASAATTRFKPLTATSDPVETPPNIATVLATNPGNTTNPGTPGGISTTPSDNGVPGGTGENPEDTGNSILTTNAVDVMPAFPGGMPEFYSKIGKNFRVPTLEDGATLKVYVSFIVEKDGSMTNIKVLRDPGYDLGKEAIRVLQTIKTKWIPGQKGGKPVRTAYNLPITVNVK
jgi:protein TonB